MKLLFDKDVALDSWGLEITRVLQDYIDGRRIWCYRRKCSILKSGYQTTDEELNHNISAAGYEKQDTDKEKWKQQTCIHSLSQDVLDKV
jgi:hypothetical protein